MHRELVRSKVKGKIVATSATIRQVPLEKMKNRTMDDDDSFMAWYGRKSYRPEQVLAKKEVISSKGAGVCWHVECRRKEKDQRARPGKNKRKKIECTDYN
jgi:hypothetical protein